MANANSNEVQALLYESLRCVWFIDDLAKTVMQNLDSLGDANSITFAGAESMLQTIQMMTGKQMELIDVLSDELNIPAKVCNTSLPNILDRPKFGTPIFKQENKES